MSLKWFHVVFISVSIVLLVWFGLWLLQNGSTLGAVVSFVAAAALGAYLLFFRKKAVREHL